MSVKSRLRSSVRTLFSFETLFVLFLFAGVYKADPRFAWLPVDLTAFLFVLSIAAAFIILYQKGFSFDPYSLMSVMVGLLFALYAVTSLAWSPGMQYAQDKALYAATLTIWALIAPALVIAPDRLRVKRFLLVLFLFSLWIAIESFLGFLKIKEIDFVIALAGEEGQGSYLPLGRVLGLGSVVVFNYLIFFAKSFWTRVSAILVFSFYFFDLLVLGGKGPFIAVMFSLPILLVLGLKMDSRFALTMKKYVVVLIIFMLITAGILTFLITSGNLTVTLTRLFPMYTDSKGESYAERVEFFDNAVRFWAQKPIFGQGLGSWPFLLNLGDARYYAHNIILEILSELGLVGLALFLAVVVLSLRAVGKMRLIRVDPYRILVLMMLMNMALNALVSGDLNDNRVLFAMLGLLFCFRREESLKQV